MRHRIAGAAALLALVTIAGCTATTSTPETRSARPAGAGTRSPGKPTLTPARRNLTVTYKLQGSSRASDSVGLTIPDNTRFDSLVRTGGQVRTGARIGRLVPDPGVVTTLSKAASTSTVARSQLVALRQRVGYVDAPVDGRLGSAGSRHFIESSGLDAVVPITPLQQLRYRSMTFAGTVTLETVFGQQTAPCESVWLESASDVVSEQETQPGEAELHCRVPSDVESAPGLPLTVTLTAKTMHDVLAIPAFYVGLDHQGRNYVVRTRRGDHWADLPVVVGPSDGVVRVIVSGLSTHDVLTPIATSR